MKILYQNHTYEVYERNTQGVFIAMANPSTHTVRHQDFAIAIDGDLMKNEDSSMKRFKDPADAISFAIRYIAHILENPD
jgi:hypothetical protein